MLKFFFHCRENIFLNHTFFPNSTISNDVYPLFFYLHFLEKHKKVHFLEKIIFEEEKSIYQSILDYEPKVCNNIEECDYVIPEPLLDADANIQTVIYELDYIIKKSNLLGKKILLFYSGRFDYIPSDLPKNIILFTSPGIKDFKNKNIYGLPTFSKDYFENNYMNKKMSISFCGCLSNSIIRKTAIDKLRLKHYSDFIINNDWGGYTNEYLVRESHKYSYTILPSKKSKKQFIENLKNNLYALCVRGGENFSYRLGEIFMMGRIPIFIDTKCILPFINYIPYEKNCIFIDFENINHIDAIVKNYHDSHTEEQLLEIQKENRNIWLEYFTVNGAFKSTYKLLESIKNK